MPTDVSSSSTESYDATVNAPAAGDARTSASVRTPLQNLVNRLRFTWGRVQELAGSFLPLSSLFPVALSVSGSTFTLTGHGLNANDPVRFWSIGGSVPAPLAQFTTYFVVGGSLTANTFQVSTTSGGAAVALTSAGSGSLYAAKMTASTLGQLLANLLASANVWTGGNTFSTLGTIFNSSATFNGTTILAGTTLVTNTVSRGGASARYAERTTNQLADTAGTNVTIDTSLGDNFTVATPTAARNIYLRETSGPTPVEGETITISRGSSGAFAILILREGQATGIVNMPASTRSSATFKFINRNDGSGVLKWTLISHFGGTPGADA